MTRLDLHPERGNPVNLDLQEGKNWHTLLSGLNSQPYTKINLKPVLHSKIIPASVNDSGIGVPVSSKLH